MNHRHGMSSLRAALVSAVLMVWITYPTAQEPGVEETTTSDRREISNGQKDFHFIGHVELKRGDVTLLADDVKYTSENRRAVATGHVEFSEGNSRITADRAEFDTETRLGVFYNAAGMAEVEPPSQPTRPGTASSPPLQDTMVYFFGDTVEKLGPRRYKVTNGGFTTCVQPTPRWNLHVESVVINIDESAVLKQAILNVKGVPMFYLPIMYYPLKKDRATGFLFPTYGISTIRGQSIHNAFFWAIGRSHDLTFMHDWYSKTGQGVGTEYRYNLGGDSDGTFRTSYLDQRATAYVQADGTQTIVPSSRSYEMRGTASQGLPAGLRARGRIDYFSDVTTMQTFNTNIFDASRSRRTIGGNLVGSWDAYTLNGTFDRTESFYNQNNSAVTGSWPRVAVTRNERPIAGTPLYFSLSTEYARLLRDNKTDVLDIDQGLTRLDVGPQVRLPFRRWEWWSANSTLSWRDTFYTRSLDQNLNVVDEGVNRRFVTAQTQLTGPILVRLWDTPGNGYAERFKHTIEPGLTITHTSSIDNASRIVQLEGTDFIVGGTVQYAYGVMNRLYAKRPSGVGQTSSAREILDVEVTQTYYSDRRAAQFDPRFASSFNGQSTSSFSPIALSVRGLPTDQLTATLRAEFDSQQHDLRTISAGGTYSTPLLQAALGWSRRVALDNSLNGSTTLRTRNSHFGGTYSFNYDILRSTLLQQRISGFYNAQCCGIALEYQNFSVAGILGAPVPSDHRFFVSVTLAGLGTFSPLNGALSDAPR